MPKVSKGTSLVTINQTLHLKMFHGPMKEVEAEYNAFMDDHFDRISVVENKSFYSTAKDGSSKIGLLVYFTMDKPKGKDATIPFG